MKRMMRERQKLIMQNYRLRKSNSRKAGKKKKQARKGRDHLD